MAEGEGQTETIQDPNSNAMPGLSYSVGTAGGTISLDSGTVWSSGVRWPVRLRKSFFSLTIFKFKNFKNLIGRISFIRFSILAMFVNMNVDSSVI